MDNFINKILGRNERYDDSVDLLKADLSFRNAQFDIKIFQQLADIDHSKTNEIVKYFHETSLLEESVLHDIKAELEFLKRFLSINKSIYPDYYIEELIFIENNDSVVPALITYPLIQNAIHYGYNSMEKYPVKIKIHASKNRLRLEVSNRVNHYMASQRETKYLKYIEARLNIYYPNRYDLLINNNSNTFKSTLLLEID